MSLRRCSSAGASRRLAAILLACLFIIQIPSISNAADSTLTTFSDGATETSISFPNGGGWNNSTSITLPKNAVVTAANVTLEPSLMMITENFTADGAQIAANTTIENLTLKGTNLSISESSWWWGQDSKSGFPNTTANRTVITPGGVTLDTDYGRFPSVAKQNLGVFTGSGNQRRPSVAAMSSGDFIVVWETAGATWDIYAQLLSATGALRGPAIPVCTAASDQWGATVAVDSKDNFIVAWYDYRSGNYDIYARRYGVNGTPLSGEFVIATGNYDQIWPDIATDSRDNFIITWMQGSGSYWDIYAKRYDMNGTQIGSEISLTTNTGDQGWPAVAVDHQDGFILTWHSSRNGNPDIFARRFDANGNTLNTDGAITTQTSIQGYPDVAFDSDNNFTVVWTDWRGGNRDIYARRYDSNATAIGQEFIVCDWSGDQGDCPSIIYDLKDNFHISWVTGGDGQWDVYARRYSSNGIPLEAPFAISTAFSDQTFQAEAMSPQGDFLFAWQSIESSDTNIRASIYRSSYCSNGTLLSPIANTTLATAGNLWVNISIPEGTDYFVDCLETINGTAVRKNLTNGANIGGNFPITAPLRLRLTMKTNDGSISPILFGWGIGTSLREPLLHNEGGIADNVVVSDGIRLAPQTNEVWAQKATPPITSRTGHSATWDSQNHQILILGGFSPPSPMNELWAYNPTSDKWTQGHSSITDRMYHSAVWDDQNNQMLVFGGFSGTTPYLNQLWAYSPTLDTWTQMASASFGRARHCAVWDPENHQMLVFGGSTDIGIINDLWAYFPSNNTWVQKTTGATARQYPCGIWDPDNHQMLIFSGWSQSVGQLNDLWAYYPANDTWVQKSSGSAKREGSSAVWDLQNHQMLVFGGSNNTDYMNDTWAYLPSNDTWVQKASGSTPRAYHTGIWDPSNKGLSIFGGTSSGSIHLNTLWRYSLSTLKWTEKSCPMSNRYSHVAVWDTQNNQMLFFGGRYDDGSTLVYMNDTWAYSPTTNSWSSKASGASPRNCHMAVWDDQNNQMLVFGGLINGIQPLADLWAYSPSTNSWAQKASCPVPRGMGTTVWDSTGKRMIAYSGQSTSGNVADTWFYYPSNDTWIKKANGPNALRWHTAVWDDFRNQMLVFGGDKTGSNYIDELWSYLPEQDVWTKLGNGATARCAQSAVWNPANQQMIIFGGEDNNWQLLNDVWIYSVRTNTWDQLPSDPIPRWGHSAVLNPTDQNMIIFGGRNNTKVFQDIWFFGEKYSVNGTYISPVRDIMRPFSFGPLNWSSTIPAGTHINVSMRSANWSDFSAWQRVTNGMSPAINPSDEKFQWKYELSTDRTDVTPVLHDMAVNYTSIFTHGYTGPLNITAPSTITKFKLRTDLAPLDSILSLKFSSDDWASEFPHSEMYETPVPNPSRNLSFKLIFHCGEYIRTPIFRRIAIDYSYGSNPSLVDLTIGNSSNLLGNFTEPKKVDLVASMNEYIAGVNTSMFEFGVPISIYSASAGYIRLTNLSITYRIGPPPNQKPVIFDPYPADGALINESSVSLSWNASDADGDLLIFEVWFNGDIIAINQTPRSYQLDNLSWYSINMWQIWAFDGKEWVEGPQWHFNISPEYILNHPPSIVLHYPVDNATVKENSATLSWGARDEDGDPIIFKVYYDNTNASTLVATTDKMGALALNLTNGTTYYWRIVVSDGVHEVSSSTNHFHVLIPILNRAPAFINQTLPNGTKGKAYAFRLNATDPDGDTIIFSRVSGPPGLSIDADGLVRFTPNAAGKYTFTAKISDGTHNVTTQYWIIVNAPTGQPTTYTDFMWPVLLLIILGAGLLLAAIVLRRRSAKKPSEGAETEGAEYQEEEPVEALEMDAEKKEMPPERKDDDVRTRMFRETADILAQLQRDLAAPSDVEKLSLAEALLNDVKENPDNLEEAHTILIGLVSSLKDKAGTKESKIEFLSEVEFYAGYVRLKAALKNHSKHAISDARIRLMFDSKSLRLSKVEPDYDVEQGDVLIGTISPDEKKTVAFYLDPLICVETMLNGVATFKDSEGNLKSLTMKPKKAAVVCPIFHTEEQINVAMLKRMMDGELTRQDRKAFRLPKGVECADAFKLGKSVVEAHDIKLVREFLEKDPFVGEAWYNGKTKPAEQRIIIRVRVLGEMGILEFFVAADDKRALTGLLAELSHGLNAKLKEKKTAQPEQVTALDILSELQKTKSLLDKMNQTEAIVGETENLIGTKLAQSAALQSIPAPEVVDEEVEAPPMKKEEKKAPPPVKREEGMTPVPNPFKNETVALKSLSSVARGLPGSLSGYSMDELAELLTKAEFVETEDGDTILRIRKKWYYGNPREADTYLQPYSKK
jgi:N-acetylneuraminic acid mutarotase